MNGSLRWAGVLTAVALLAGGCHSDKPARAASRSTTSAVPTTDSPTASATPSTDDPTTDNPTTDDPTTSSASPSPAPSTEFVPTPDVGQPCSLLSNGAISGALGVQVSGGKPNSRALFVGCDYTLAGTGGSGTLVLYAATSRGPQIYGSVLSGGGFDNVLGVGNRAAYSPEDGRFIVTTDKDFVELTLPFNLKGASSDTPAGATKAGTALAKQVLSALP